MVLGGIEVSPKVREVNTMIYGGLNSRHRLGHDCCPCSYESSSNALSNPLLLRMPDRTICHPIPTQPQAPVPLDSIRRKPILVQKVTAKSIGAHQQKPDPAEDAHDDKIAHERVRFYYLPNTDELESQT